MSELSDQQSLSHSTLIEGRQPDGDFLRRIRDATLLAPGENSLPLPDSPSQLGVLERSGRAAGVAGESSALSNQHVSTAEPMQVETPTAATTSSPMGQVQPPTAMDIAVLDNRIRAMSAEATPSQTTQNPAPRRVSVYRTLPNGNVVKEYLMPNQVMDTRSLPGSPGTAKERTFSLPSTAPNGAGGGLHFIHTTPDSNAGAAQVSRRSSGSHPAIAHSQPTQGHFQSPSPTSTVPPIVTQTSTASPARVASPTQINGPNLPYQPVGVQHVDPRRSNAVMVQSVHPSSLPQGQNVYQVPSLPYPGQGYAMSSNASGLPIQPPRTVMSQQGQYMVNPKAGQLPNASSQHVRTVFDAQTVPASASMVHHSMQAVAQASKANHHPNEEQFVREMENLTVQFQQQYNALRQAQQERVAQQQRLLQQQQQQRVLQQQHLQALQAMQAQQQSAQLQQGFGQYAQSPQQVQQLHALQQLQQNDLRRAIAMQEHNKRQRETIAQQTLANANQPEAPLSRPPNESRPPTLQQTSFPSSGSQPVSPTSVTPSSGSISPHQGIPGASSGPGAVVAAVPRSGPTAAIGSPASPTGSTSRNQPRAFIPTNTSSVTDMYPQGSGQAALRQALPNSGRPSSNATSTGQTAEVACQTDKSDDLLGAIEVGDLRDRINELAQSMVSRNSSQSLGSSDIVKQLGLQIIEICIVDRTCRRQYQQMIGRSFDFEDFFQSSKTDFSDSNLPHIKISAPRGGSPAKGRKLDPVVERIIMGLSEEACLPGGTPDSGRKLVKRQGTPTQANGMSKTNATTNSPSETNGTTATRMDVDAETSATTLGSETNSRIDKNRDGGTNPVRPP